VRPRLSARIRETVPVVEQANNCQLMPKRPSHSVRWKRRRCSIAYAIAYVAKSPGITEV